MASQIMGGSENLKNGFVCETYGGLRGAVGQCQWRRNGGLLRGTGKLAYNRLTGKELQTVLKERRPRVKGTETNIFSGQQGSNPCEGAPPPREGD